MYKSLEIFQTASAMARNAGARQAVVARNIANADTPGYKAQEVAKFSDAMDAQSARLRTTRPGHITQSPQVSSGKVTTTGEPSPNGNTVALEDELMKSVAITRDHDKALAVYRHAMTVLRTSLGKL
ncbi:FlgB family protein [Loktanella sp. S4079]|uniref:FlgB family protein n=1 Tax=Loktanella sp. S4079 TaxID=579483 RepID=UPI0005FA6020|nr:FlgB family protein [Loktanella sp. S4079]KJZ21145.1 hypothetical protein TW80_00350 [Loktanella sp. S4079]